MTKKIFRAIIVTVMTVMLLSIAIATSFLYDYSTQVQTTQLKQELSLAAASVETSGVKCLENLNSSLYRFTLIKNDGTVLFDTQADAEKMENHLERDEVRQALIRGEGSSRRYSATLTEKTNYEAILLSNGNVLRVSMNQVTVGVLIIAMTPAICAILIASVAAAFLLSGKMARKIVEPLEKLDLEHPAENDAYEELAPILTKLNLQHKQIISQMQEMKRKADEFEQITSSMTEGLIILDKNGLVLSMNNAAKALFGAGDSAVGRSFLEINRSESINKAIENALCGKRGELRERINENEYQFIFNYTEFEERICGCVIICFNVTESVMLEQNRREFTANVSHELKTPLQGIIGSAELLESGLVKAEDTSRFIENIKNEAERLIGLINDIIRLSQLDECLKADFEPVDLCDTACEVIKKLSFLASEKNVKIDLIAQPCVINGVRRYIYDILYNLTDNALRYNKDGGSITVEIKKENENAVISVSDTGIGIPAEHLERIFERFYRVDKSHSKETGGTGLGLSIVKHAAAYHGGTVSVKSTVGKGTVFTVIL